MYPEFKQMEDKFKNIDITINYATAQDHVPPIERVIRTVKERFISLYYQRPYKSIPKVMVQYEVKFQMKWLNMFPTKGGVSKKYIPISILTAKPVDYKNIARGSVGVMAKQYIKLIQQIKQRPGHLVSYIYKHQIHYKADLKL